MVLYTSYSRNHANELTSDSRLVAVVTLQATHGLSADSADDPLIRSINKALDEFSQISAPGAYLVDSFPLCEQLNSTSLFNGSTDNCEK